MDLGGRTVAEWRDRMTASEFVKWKEFYRHEPSLAHRLDQMHALAQHQRYMLGTTSKAPIRSVHDFLPPWSQHLPPPASPDDVDMKLTQFFRPREKKP